MDEHDDNPIKGINWQQVADQAMKLEYDRRRISACGWFAAFFFNPIQRSRVVADWKLLCQCVSFAEQFTLARPQPAPDETLGDLSELEAGLGRVKRAGPKVFSETELLKPESLTLDLDSYKNRLLDHYSQSGITVEPGLESLVDTLPAEFAFLQALIAQGSDDKEQARFFYGHLRPLGFASVKALCRNSESRPVERVADMMKRYLITEEALFKNGYSGDPASMRTLN